MPRLYNYKLWNTDLSQFVAQRDMRTADEISALGGIIIPERSSIPGFAEPPPASTASRRERMAADHLTAAH